MKLDEISDSSSSACPLFYPKNDVELLHRLATTANDIESIDGDRRVSTILDLCVALWGNMNFFSSETGLFQFIFYLYILLNLL